MPLRDHFRAPVNDRHVWNELHGGWPMMLVRQLFDVLPAGYVAAPSVHIGQLFEIDVSAFELDAPAGPVRQIGSADGGVATAERLRPTLTLETDLADQDEFEVRVYDAERGRQLVAAIELVSPANKDRPETRRAFVTKIAALLQKDVSVSIVDLVTIRQFNLYADLLDLIGGTDPQLGPDPPYLYAVSIRARQRPAKRALVDVWHYPMALSQPLPTLPLWLAPDLQVLLPLEPSYEETCRLLRIT